MTLFALFTAVTSFQVFHHIFFCPDRDAQRLGFCQFAAGFVSGDVGLADLAIAVTGVLGLLAGIVTGCSPVFT
jgi:hypothetical protein